MKYVTSVIIINESLENLKTDSSFGPKLYNSIMGKLKESKHIDDLTKATPFCTMFEVSLVIEE